MSVIPPPLDWVESVSSLRLPAETNRRLQELMDRNSEGELTADERAELESLVEISEQLSLVRVKAFHLLARRVGRTNEMNWEDQQEAELWNRVLEKLAEWSASPCQVTADDWEMPTGECLLETANLVKWLRANHASAPTRIVPTGEGGIVLERRDGSDTASIEIDEQGTVEITLFDDCHVVYRNRLQLD